MENGLNVISVKRIFIEHLMIIANQRVKDSFVQEVVIVHGKIKM